MNMSTEHNLQRTLNELFEQKILCGTTNISNEINAIVVGNIDFCMCCHIFFILNQSVTNRR